MDAILTALLALCAMMVVFSTAVTVAQQALHKGLQSRRGGMLRMMQALYVRALAPRLKKDGLLNGPDTPADRKREALRFSLDMTANETLMQTGMWRWASEAPVLRRYFGGRLESMTTQQFAEQLARTNVGLAIGHQDDKTLTETLHTYAYEFERFGDWQSDMFKRRATAAAVAIGLILAFVLNVDVLHSFMSLTKDKGSAERIVGILNSETFQKVTQAAAQQSSATLVDTSKSDAAPSGDKLAATQTDLKESLGQLNQNVQGLNAELLAAKQSQEELGGLGLPIGPRVFPFCQPYAGAGPSADQRCGDNAQPAGLGQFYFVSGPAVNGLKQACPPNSSFLGICWDHAQLDQFWPRLFHSSYGMIWLVSVLVAGGGFGLGAPFWYNVFNKLSSAAPAGKLAQLTLPAVSGTSDGEVLAVRSDKAVTPTELLHAFRTVQSSVAHVTPPSA